MHNRIKVIAALFLALALLTFQAAAFAQSPVPMLFTGTATLDGRAVASGTTVTVYTARGLRVASATTGASGQAANAWTLTAFDTSLEDQTLYFYITIGGRLLPTPEQRQVTAVYDAEGGRGRATVAIDVQTPTATPTPTPPPTRVRQTAPTPPSIFQASPDRNRGVLLAWRDTALNEDGYELWRWDAVNGWKQLGMLPANTASYQDRGLTAGTTYYYYVGAYNSVGYSDFIEASAMVTVPVLRTPGSLRADVSGTAIRLSWSDETTGEDGYELWRWNERTSWTYLGGLNANTSSYADSGLTPGATYWYYLASYYGVTYSTWAEVSAEIPVAPARVTPTPERSGDAERGRSVFNTKGCSGCHSTGTNTVVGPGLNGLAARAATRKANLEARGYIEESILQPSAFVVQGFAAGIMPTLFQSNNDEGFNDLVTYLLTLR